ncbi:hypothetical protein WME88_28445 [Sorangium sp. So ce216]
MDEQALVVGKLGVRCVNLSRSSVPLVRYFRERHRGERGEGTATRAP